MPNHLSDAFQAETWMSQSTDCNAEVLKWSDFVCDAPHTDHERGSDEDQSFFEHDKEDQVRGFGMCFTEPCFDEDSSVGRGRNGLHAGIHDLGYFSSLVQVERGFGMSDVGRLEMYCGLWVGECPNPAGETVTSFLGCAQCV